MPSSKTQLIGILLDCCHLYEFATQLSTPKLSTVYKIRYQLKVLRQNLFYYNRNLIVSNSNYCNYAIHDKMMIPTIDFYNDKKTTLYHCKTKIKNLIKNQSSILCSKQANINTRTYTMEFTIYSQWSKWMSHILKHFNMFQKFYNRRYTYDLNVIIYLSSKIRTTFIVDSETRIDDLIETYEDQFYYMVLKKIETRCCPDSCSHILKFLSHKKMIFI